MNDSRNSWAGHPDDMAARIQEAAERSLATEIRAAINELTQGKNGRYEATIGILACIIGEADDQ